MRRPVDAEQVRAFMTAVGRSVRGEHAVYFVGGATAVALAKLERGYDRDLEDVREMLAHGLVERNRLLASFSEIEPELYRYPAIDPKSFRRRVEAIVAAS